MESNISDDVSQRINKLTSCNQKQEFIKNVKDILEFCGLLNLSNSEEKIFKFVVTLIKEQYEKVYNENYSLFETLEDEVAYVLIKENLEMAFQLTETLQEILNFIYPHSPINVCEIESIMKNIPEIILLFTNHWKNSSENYRIAFNADIFKLLEVIKHLYASYLHILEFSVSMEDDEYENNLLVKTLTSMTELPKALYELDNTTLISSWKCISTISVKYATLLENSLDLGIIINALGEDIFRALKSISYKDSNSFNQEIRNLTVLLKMLFKLIDIFYQQLITYSLELICLFIRIYSTAQTHFQEKKIPLDALNVLETEVLKNVDVFLEHSLMGQIGFKNKLINILKQQGHHSFQKYPLGVIVLLCKIFHLVSVTHCNWFDLTTNCIEVVCSTIPLCDKQLLEDSDLYQSLVVNISAAVLFQDISFQSANILLKNILQNNFMVATLALDVYTLVISNVSSNECLALLIQILYGVDVLMCGFFTNRPEMIYLKILIQRMFKILPSSLREDIVKLFRPEQHIQIWRFLGFADLPSRQAPFIINPVMKNTSENVSTLYDTCTEDTLLNIAEGLDLLSTLESLDTSDIKMIEITKFVDTFWSTDFDGLLENNVMNYFVMKIVGVTSNCLLKSNLDLQMVFTKLNLLLSKESYWLAVYKIIHSILNCLSSYGEPRKKLIMTQIAEIINKSTQNKSNTFLKAALIQLLKNMNETQNEILNMLLDNLDSNVANNVFQYIQDSTKAKSLLLRIYEICDTKPFKHTCLIWKQSINDGYMLKSKRLKMEISHSNGSQEHSKLTSVPSVIKRTIQHQTNTKHKENIDIPSTNINEDDSSALEVIDKIKSEVKCLMKICKTDQLTKKNVSDIRIVMSQLSSLI